MVGTKSLNVVLVTAALWTVRLGGCLQVLKKDGYNVSIVQNPTVSLADDVAATKLVLPRRTAP